jgi:putative hydrolase of the HAD superfamily
MYQNYIFDLYGTLVDVKTDENDPELWRRLTLHYGYHGARWEPEALRSAYRQDVRSRLAAITGTAHPDIPIQDCFAELYRLKGVNPDAATVSATCRTFRLLSTAYLFPYPATLAVLDELRHRSRRLFLLSNAQAEFTRPELQALGLEARFDAVRISSEMGMAKPEPRFLQELLENEGLDPRQTLMTGNDLTTDIEVARRCGVDSAFLNTNHSIPEWLAAAPGRATHVLADGDLAGLLAIDESRRL